MDPKDSKKLRALVYAGLAGGLVGVSTMSAYAHGNASSHGPSSGQISWQADDIVVAQQDKQQQEAPTK